MPQLQHGRLTIDHLLWIAVDERPRRAQQLNEPDSVHALADTGSR